MKNWEEQFDEKFNHDSPNGKAIVIIENDDNSGVSQRPAQNEIKQFIKQTITEVIEEVIGEEANYGNGAIAIALTDGYNQKRKEIIDIMNKLIK